MLDIKQIEENLEEYKKRLATRQKDYNKDLDELIKINSKRKKIIKDVEELKAEKNKLSKEIGILARENKKNEIEKIKLLVNQLNEKIEVKDNNLKDLNIQLKEKLSYIPNIPYKNIVVGLGEKQNVEIRKWNNDSLKKDGIPHWDIAIKLNIVDFEMGTKLSGSRFLVYNNNGAKLLRAITDILMKIHSKNGYQEAWLPLIVNKENMYGTGQIPKFEDDAYRVDDQYLIPTSEVSLTNFVRDCILEKNQLPIYLTAFTQCFRKEAGSAGRDTKGMIRLHQFNKVEMVKISYPENSFEELEMMVKNAEECLQIFNLPYRVIELCSGDLGFSAQKTYDLEVWFPNQNKYREISSCSNCGDFQARRIMARFKDMDGNKKYVHTLNGSGLAIDRLIAAILENYYDGEKLLLPKVLRPYFNNEKYLK